ncbi:hypothetical protein PpBr36_03372 [Pyricularia pennisetigena]|uniref:hypothetical protein n=1 Tax=Pyricularia pennisetigena TaxID=1578925 RepID=UPI00114F9943|nr:hypothetical protein PpBr36_03372 [Pyricularia pennisetigena]TLS29891.1 hypothetical protein PpBr36_03372 [Pyricularia pennisetigena]
MASQAQGSVVETVDEKHTGQKVSDVVPEADSSSDKSREPHPVRKDKDDDDGASLPSMEVLHAAGVGLDEDDPNQPCLTIRMWVIGIAFCILGSGVNALNTMRVPSTTLSQSAIQFLAYPIGKAWEYALPDWGVTIFGSRISLNPGPFNAKENILIYILANLSFLSRLSVDVLIEQRVFYGLDAGWGFELLMTASTLLLGFALSGIFRKLVVEPPSLMWPGVLGNTALNHTLHSKDKVISESRWKMSRYTFFMIAFCASFTWYWFPDFIFPALSYFSFICWAAPNNVVVNQIFGMKSGMGLMPVTFDWAQVAYINNPLVVPPWAIMNVFASLVIWVWILAPILYYTNTWNLAYLPFQDNAVFDNMGKSYNVSRVIDKQAGFTFNVTKYENYSEIYMPATYAINTFGLCFATITSLFVWLALEKRDSLRSAISSSWLARRFMPSRYEPPKPQPQPQYRVAPTWWYVAAGVVALAFGIVSCEAYPVQLRWYGVVFSFLISYIFFLPLAWVYATTNIKIQIEVICRVIAGYAYEGKVLANIWFFNLGYISGIKALAFAQDLKLGLYCNVPPIKLFIVQVVGIIFATLSQVGVLNWALGSIPGICTTKAENGFTCPFSRTHFNTSMIWGAVGPRRFFGPGALYAPLLWFLLIGAALPVLVWGLRHPRALGRYEAARWLKHVHVPVFLGGLNYIPPATGANYASWAIVGLAFGLVMRRRASEWWGRYNFVLAAALDCSVAIAGVIIFFAVFYTGVGSKFSWWGTHVHKNTCDWTGCSYLSLPNGKKFGP